MSPSANDDHAGVAAARQAWVAAVARRDPAALRDLLTEDYEVWAHGAPPVRGPEGAAAAMAAALGRFDIEQGFEPVETVIAGDWAFERGVERMRVTPVGGGPSQEMTQRALLILRRGSDGRWRYARGMTNGLPAPTPAQPASGASPAPGASAASGASTASSGGSTGQPATMLVVFTDLTEFKSQAERIDDRAIVETLETYYERVASAIQKAGGTVVKLIGDAVLIVFPESAIDAGVRALLELSPSVDRLMVERGWDCRLAVKAHVGAVIAGEFGAPGHKRFDVLGRAVNRAARLPSTGITLSADAFERVSPEVRARFVNDSSTNSYRIRAQA